MFCPPGGGRRHQITIDGFGENTLEEFQEFILDLLSKQETMESKLISSQINSTELKGSETRVYNSERILKLHENLEEIKQILKINYYKNYLNR